MEAVWQRVGSGMEGLAGWRLNDIDTQCTATFHAGAKIRYGGAVC